MFTIETYRAVLNRIFQLIRNMRGTESATITITSEEMRVVNVLVEESDINILSVHDDYSGTQFTSSGRLIPSRNIIIEIDLSDENLHDRIETRLSDLNNWIKEYSSIFGDVSDGRTVESGRYQGFVSYGSGLITFNGKPVILPKREAYLLAHFINHAGQLVYATEIIDEYYTGESNNSPMTVCSKILSPLNNKLMEITGTKNAIKTVDAQNGYILDLT